MKGTYRMLENLLACLLSSIAVSNLSYCGAIDRCLDIFKAVYHLDLGLTFKQCFAQLDEIDFKPLTLPSPIHREVQKLGQSHEGSIKHSQFWRGGSGVHTLGLML